MRQVEVEQEVAGEDEPLYMQNVCGELLIMAGDIKVQGWMK